MRNSQDAGANRRPEACPYGAAYYRNYHTCDGPKPYERTRVWLDFFGAVADTIVRTIQPRRVFDAGCAIGMLVESLRDRGVDAWGADISEFAISKVRPDLRPYCAARSITEPFGGRFDLVTCIEVLEHLPEQEGRRAVARMCASGDLVLFSSTPGDLDEPTHINVHEAGYWIELFDQFGFDADENYDASFLSPHAILFRRRRERGAQPTWSPERIAELEAEVLTMRRRSLTAEAEASELKGRLESILESPGWRMVSRYRQWMRAARWLEKPAAWLLRKLTRRGQAEHRRANAPGPAIPSASYKEPNQSFIDEPERIKWESRPSITVVLLAEEDPDRTFEANVVRVPCSPSIIPLARLVNDSVGATNSDVIVFLDETVEPCDDTLLDEIAGPLSSPGVAVCGVCAIGFNHSGDLLNQDARRYSNCFAVSGACFAIRRDVFDQLGGFSSEPAFPRLDIDLCLRVFFEARQRVAVNPIARVRKSGVAALERWIGEDAEHIAAEYLRSNFPDGDPLANPCTEKILASPASALSAYDCTSREIKDSIESCAPRDQTTNHFVWFLPEFDRATSGNVLTVLRMAEYFQRSRGIHSTFVVPGRAHVSVIRERIANISPGFAECGVEVVLDMAAVSRLAPSDAAIAATWDSAYRLLRYNKTGQKFYFLDPGNSAEPLVDASWRFGFKGLCASPPLRDLYVARGGEAQLFTPCIDRDVFYSATQPTDAGAPYTLLRPADDGGLIEPTLDILKRRLGSRLRIVTSERGDVASGALYRICDAALMRTAGRASYDLALRLMACGCLVIGDHSPALAWLLRNGDNCLFAAATPSALAASVEEGLSNAVLRQRLVASAAQKIHCRHYDWNRSAEQVLSFILRITSARPALEDQHPK